MKKEISKQLQIEEIKIPLAKEFILEEDNITWLLEGFEGLKKLSFDFTQKEGIKDAKALKTTANKFIKEFKEFCDPLEEEGKKISSTRSKVKLKLESVIDEILAPIVEREEKIKAIKNKLFIPSLDAASSAAKLAGIEALDGYEWLGFAEEALPLIEQQRQFLLGEKVKFEAEAKAKLETEERARAEREDKIREEAAAKARADAQKAIDEANKKAEEAKLEVAKLQSATLASAAAAISPISSSPSKDRQKKINNEILEDLKSNTALGDDLAKEIIKSIAKGEIRHLKIQY